jgi:hypothetical protein
MSSHAIAACAAFATPAPHAKLTLRSRRSDSSNISINIRRVQSRRRFRTSSVVVSSLSPSLTIDDVKDAAEEWLKLDTNAATRSEIQSMLDAGENSTLADRLLTGRLEFGTAGLRGLMVGVYFWSNPPIDDNHFGPCNQSDIRE